MRDFNRNTRSSGGSGRSGPREMHQATCNDCGRSCEVLFKPTRPVLCSDCFEKSGNGDHDTQHSRPPRLSRASSSGDRAMYKGVCASCGNNCNLPFQPRNGKPVYCSKCFEESGTAKAPRNFTGAQQGPKSITTEQYEILNTKMDKILKILTKVQLAIDETEVTAENLIGDPPNS